MSKISICVHTDSDMAINGKVLGDIEMASATRFLEIGGCTVFVNSRETVQRLHDALDSLYKPV